MKNDRVIDCNVAYINWAYLVITDRIQIHSDEHSLLLITMSLATAIWREQYWPVVIEPKSRQLGSFLEERIGIMSDYVPDWIIYYTLLNNISATPSIFHSQQIYFNKFHQWMSKNTTSLHLSQSL